MLLTYFGVDINNIVWISICPHQLGKYKLSRMVSMLKFIFVQYHGYQHHRLCNTTNQNQYHCYCFNFIYDVDIIVGLGHEWNVSSSADQVDHRS